MKISHRSLRKLVSEIVREQLGPRVVRNVRELKNALSVMDDSKDLVIMLNYKGKPIVVRDISIEEMGDEGTEVVLGGELEDWN